jgi:hypothetical protein
MAEELLDCGPMMVTEVRFDEIDPTSTLVAIARPWPDSPGAGAAKLAADT